MGEIPRACERDFTQRGGRLTFHVNSGVVGMVSGVIRVSSGVIPGVISDAVRMGFHPHPGWR